MGEYPISEEAIQEGGIQSVTYSLAHALARRGDVECHVVAAMNGATVDYRQVGALHVHYIRRLRLPRLLTLRTHELPALVPLIRSLDPHIVHGEGQDRHARAALMTGLPTVITPHGVLFIESRIMKKHGLDLVGSAKMHLINAMERRVFKDAGDMIIISRYLTQIYGSMLHARTHFIENPIGPEFFELRRTPEPGRLLFVGTVVPRKRVHDLVVSLAKVLRMSNSSTKSDAQWQAGLQLRIAGPLSDSESVAMVRRAIESEKLEDRVAFLGPLSQNQLLDEYARAQLLVMASREETAPQVIAQAMACGLPTVASAVGGIPSMVTDGETALLYPLSDTDACARQIYRLLDDQKTMHAMEIRIAQEGRQRFHPDSVAEQTAHVYRQVISRSTS